MYSSDISTFVIGICKPLVKDQSSFYEIRSLAICINIKVFNRVNKKPLNILETFLEYLEPLLLVIEDDLALKYA